MRYYVIRFTAVNKYYWGKNLLVHSLCSAKKYTSRSYARKVVQSSAFSHMDYEIISFEM